MTGRTLSGVTVLAMAGVLSGVLIDHFWDRYSQETEALGFSGIYERYLASRARRKPAIETVLRGSRQMRVKNIPPVAILAMLQKPAVANCPRRRRILFGSAMPAGKASKTLGHAMFTMSPVWS